MLTLPDPALIARYAGRGPRYTSYPPVPVWSDRVGADEYREGLREAAEIPAPLALYVHLPFCRERCWYCGCNVVIQRDVAVADAYLDRVEREAEEVGALLGGRRPVTSLHLGGGTPNFLTEAQLERLLGFLRRAMPFAEDAGLDVEVDPRVAEPGRIAHLAGLGFRRMSFGVQDLDPDVGAAVGRRMDAEHLAGLMAEARAAGVRGINLDLMYGLPLQTPESLSRTLERVVALRPDRLAIYGYAHVPWMRPQQRRLERSGLPGPEERILLFSTALARLSEAGYLDVGLDHFALPGDPLLEARDRGTMDRSFQGYTTVAEDLVGLGASSIGYLRSLRRPLYVQNATPVKLYERTPGFVTVRGYRLTPDDVLRGRVIRSVLCRLEVRSEPGFDLWRTFPEAFDGLEALERDGLVVREPQALRVTPLGRHFLRPIAMHFDGWLRQAAPVADGERAYSQTV